MILLLLMLVSDGGIVLFSVGSIIAGLLLGESQFGKSRMQIQAVLLFL